MKNNNRTHKKKECLYKTLDKVAEMQQEICTYERFQSQLFVYLIKEGDTTSIATGTLHAEDIYCVLDILLKELKELREFKANHSEKEDAKSN